MRRLLALTLVFSTGCFDAHGEERRLRQIVWVPEGGGEPVLGAMYDRELGTDCAFLPDGGGALRCVPIPTTSALVFADAGCTEALLSLEDGCEAPAYATHLRYGEAWEGCGPRPADRPLWYFVPYRVGGARTLERGYRMELDGTCSPVELSGAALRALTPLDPSELVTGEPVDPPAEEPDLTRTAFLTEEGALLRGEGALHTSIVHREHGPCALLQGTSVHRPPPERVPCLFGEPVDVFAVRSGCEEVHGLTRPDKCDDAELAAEEHFDECGASTSYTLYTVGEARTAAELPELCTIPEGRGYVTLEPAPAEAGTWFERRLRGEARVQRYSLEHPDVTVPLELHRDTTLGFDCRPVRSGDEVVCMPGNPEGSTRVFADAECTVLATLGGSCEPYPHVLTLSCAGLSSLAALYRATHPIDRAWYLDEASGACVELEDAVALDAYALEEIPLDSLARFTRELR